MDSPELDSVYNFAITVRLSDPKSEYPHQRNASCGHLIASPSEDGGGSYRCIINFGNVADSRDGEARPIAISQKSFNAVLESEFWELVEEPFIKYTERMSLDSFFYFPSIATPEERQRFKGWFFGARYDFKIALAFFYHLLESHKVDPVRFSTTSFDWLRDDLVHLLGIVHDVESRFGPRVLATTIFKFVPQWLEGLKIIPITTNELGHIDDIRYRVWRECYVQNMCSRIRLAKVAYHFPRYKRWNMVHDIDEDMFANPFVIARFERSSASHEIRGILGRISRAESADQYGEEFNLAMDYAAGDIEISNIAIAVASSIITGRFQFRAPDDFDGFRDVVFGWLYAFLVMHAHIGAIHADAHAGNLHVHQTGKNHPVIIDNRIYRPKTQFRGTLIDFSRVIINPMFPLTQIYTAANPEVFAREQGRYLMRFYHTVYPNSPSATMVEALVRDDFNRAFHILSLLDPIFALNAIRGIVSDEKSLDFVDQTIVKLKAILEGLLTHAEAAPIDEFPLQRFIIEHFGLAKFEDSDAGPLKFDRPIDYKAPTLSEKDAEILGQILLHTNKK